MNDAPPARGADPGRASASVAGRTYHALPRLPAAGKTRPGEFEVLEPAQQSAAAGKDGKTGNHGEAGAPGKEGAAPAAGTMLPSSCATGVAMKLAQA